LWVIGKRARSGARAAGFGSEAVATMAAG
jgi:hypothetical protein